MRALDFFLKEDQKCMMLLSNINKLFSQSSHVLLLENQIQTVGQSVKYILKI
jgi:hypothetical protein